MLSRRSLLATLGAAPVLAHLLTACGQQAGEGTDTTAPGAGPQPFTQARSDVARITSGLDAGAGTEAINAFAEDLYRTLVAADPDANLVVSPASIVVALAMTAAGARGTTLDEMVDVLHLGDPQTIHSSLNAVTADLTDVDRTQDDRTVQLTIANSLWAQNGVAFEQAFLDLLAGSYGAGVRLVDYANDTEGARLAINAWVDEQTRSRIPELLPKDTLTVDTVLTLVNAVYLKAQWDTAFTRDLTTDDAFTTSTGEAITVPTMHQTAGWQYAAGDGWQTVTLPYVFGSLQLTICLPADPTVELPSLADQLSGSAQADVILSLPRFDIETKVGLKDTLSGMGMPTAFSSDADFTGMVQRPKVRIDNVIHQANITTDEDGTEAAAATAVIMVGESAPAVEPEPVVMTVDRPFRFWLHLNGDAIVFAGRVTDPRG